MSNEIDFSDINRDDILKALKKYDELKEKGELNNNRQAKDYLLFWNSKEYPHKYVVGIAYGLKYNQGFLDHSLYNSTGNHKASAQWCIEKNEFILYADKKYKEYLQRKYDNQTTINTYYSDLKKAIKIFQNIEKFKNKNLNEIFEEMQKGTASSQEYDIAQNELEFKDKQLFSTLKTKAKTYLEAISNKGDGQMNNSESKEDTRGSAKNLKPLNQILYGPPGTGKTYNTINKALEIIFEKETNKDRKIKFTFLEHTLEKTISYLEDILKKSDIEISEDERKDLKTAFENYKEQGQIEFVTFHQSYGYEEFVQGIKAKTTENENIKYQVESGIFKNLCEKAIKNSTNCQKENIFEFDKFLKDYIDFIEKELSQSSTFNLENKITIEEINKNKDGDFISFSLGGSVKSHQRLTKNIIKRDFENFIKGDIENFSDIKPKNKSQSTSHGNAVYYFKLYQSMKQFMKNIDEKTYYNKSENCKNYIIIIDEINRGNISKIFDELITLIEPCKRIGENEEISLKLPYSTDSEDPYPFGVPSNLYIIGTMNTADRSIAQIDTALRRRFVFEEMMPKPELLKDIFIKNIEIQKVLEAINERIEYLYGREHTIGHSYFMPLIKTSTKAKLDEIFKVNIIPLLAEYFYGDWADIKVILNDTNDYFITEKTKPTYIMKESKNNNKIYTVNKDDFRETGYQNIYAIKQVNVEDQ